MSYGTMNALSPKEWHHLEEYLRHRPDQATLVDKNILKDAHLLAPTLVKVSEQIKCSFLQHKIHDRPEVTDLICRGIIKEQSEVDNHRREVANNLEYMLNHRPEPYDLKQKHIIPSNGDSVAPAIQAVQHKLAKNSQKIKLSNRLMHRPTPEEVSRRIMSYNPVTGKIQLYNNNNTGVENDISNNNNDHTGSEDYEDNDDSFDYESMTSD